MQELTDGELGWIAGIIDGEGCIDVGKRTPPTYKGRTQWRCILRVVNTDPRIIFRLEELCGGAVQKPRLLRPGTRPAYEWTLGAQPAALLLTELLPFLVGKRDQAEIAIRFAATLIYSRRGTLALPENVASERNNMILAIHESRAPKKAIS